MDRTFWSISLFLLFALLALSASGELSTRFYAKRSADETDIDTKEMIKLGKQGLKQVAKSATQIIDVGQSAVKLLRKLADIMTGFGPQMAVAGFVISLITMFLPQEESAEMKFMKEKFAEVNNKLDVITSQLDSIDTAVEYNGAKVSFGPYIRKINSLKRNLQYVLEAKTDEQQKRNQEYFVESFASMYHDSAMTLYTGMIGEESQYFGYDLLDITTKKYKCNINKIFEFCAVNGKSLADAMALEGAYFGFKNMTYRIKSEGDKWKDRMKKLGARCQNFMTTCTKDWKKYSDPLIDTTYKRKASASNADMASEMYKQLSQNVPQRAWAVWVYNDAWGFGPHTVISSKGTCTMLWHKHGKCVTVSSVDRSYSHFDKVRSGKVMDGAVGDLANCKKRKRGDPASRITSGLKDHLGGWKGGALYAIQMGIGLEFRITQGHYATRTVEKNSCQRYNHHLFVFH